MGEEQMRADRRGANLRAEYLGGAHRANLRRADLYRACLRGDDFGGPQYVIGLGQPDGWWAFAYLWEGHIWVNVGCRIKSLAEGRAYWTGKDNRREVMAALDYAEEIARLRGWEFT